MRTLRNILSMTIARNKEFYRDRGTMIWNFLFPFCIIFGFAFAFSGGPRDLYKVGVLNTREAGGDWVSAAEESPGLQAFFETDYIQFLPIREKAEGLHKIDRHQLDLLLEPGPPVHYWVNSTSPNGYILERVLRGAGVVEAGRETVAGQEVRYVDWLVPGLLALNMSFSALFGVGYAVVRYRKNGVLKRLRATPLRAFEFLAAQAISRLLLMMAVAVLVYVGADLVIGLRMLGSYFNLALVFALGTLCMVSLGLVIASRLTSEELAGGLVNLIAWPMMFLAGVWFSLEGAHAVVQKTAWAFPLTHVVSACRSIMIDGAGLLEIGPHLLILSAMTVVFMSVGSALFRWD